MKLIQGEQPTTEVSIQQVEAGLWSMHSKEEESGPTRTGLFLTLSQSTVSSTSYSVLKNPTPSPLSPVHLLHLLASPSPLTPPHLPPSSFTSHYLLSTLLPGSLSTLHFSLPLPPLPYLSPPLFFCVSAQLTYSHFTYSHFNY